MSLRKKDNSIVVNRANTHLRRPIPAGTEAWRFSLRESTLIMTGNDIFEELFVLELANNHLGDVQRGLKIINHYAQVVRFNNVRAAIKLQLRDVGTFVHQDFRHRDDIRDVKKTLDTDTWTELEPYL